MTRYPYLDVWSNQRLAISAEANLGAAEVKRQRCRSQNRQQIRGRVM
jgi:hypothetical protein